MNQPYRNRDLIPAGIIAFLFSDVEGSSRLWEADAVATAQSLELHDELVRRIVGASGGYIFGWAGDHFRAAFEDAQEAVDAAVTIQDELAHTDWRDGPSLRVRIGLHRGHATQRDGDYFGPVPNTAARLEASAAGGQILLSNQVAKVVDAELLSIGRHRLRDVPQPMLIHQIGLTAFPAIKAPDPSLSTLPNPGLPIIGRDDELAKIRELLESASMITLIGPGGSGKTRLALEVAYQELAGRADGCYFADLGAVSDGSRLPAALATAVRLELSASDPLSQVVEHLTGREALLLLDNCEHLIDDCVGFVEKVCAGGSSTAILATSRERLSVAGEQVVEVGPLDHAGSDSPAVALFAERARAANPAFECVGPRRQVVAAICAQLDGMPLPIELAAARASVLTPSEIMDRMGDRFRLLSGGRGRKGRPTLQSTLDWSYDLLDDDEQRFFRQCGVFVGSFDLRAAAVVSGVEDYEAVDLIESLVTKSLLLAVEGHNNRSTRYRFLKTIRMYAGDQLVRTGEVNDGRDAHLAHFFGLVATNDFVEASCLNRAKSLQHDWPNIASCLDSLVKCGDYGRAASVAFGCLALWESGVPAPEGRRWIQKILEHLEPGEKRDWLDYIDAALAMQLDEFIDVHRTLARLCNDSALRPRTQAVGLFAYLSCRQNPAEAVRLVELGRELEAEGNLGGEYLCPIVWSDACLALYEARYEDALKGYHQAFDCHLPFGRECTHSLMSGLSLAASHILVGDPETALETLGRLDWSKSIWDSSQIVRALALIDLGRPDEASDLVVSFGNDALEGRLNRMANDAMVGFAALAINRGEAEHAWQLLLQAVSPRSPFTIGLSEGLADRIGCGGQLRKVHRGRKAPLSEMNAASYLRAELDRVCRLV